MASTAPMQLLFSDLSVVERRGIRGRAVIIALGGEQRSTLCVLRDGRAELRGEFGNLRDPTQFRLFNEAVNGQVCAAAGRPVIIAHDLHPAYLSTQLADCLAARRFAVQHHHAHVAAVLAEHACEDRVIGLACDGSGLGLDGAVWGCELLACRRDRWRRVGHLEYVPLAGGDAAALETWRPAAALLRAAEGPGWRQRFPTFVPDVNHDRDNGRRLWPAAPMPHPSEVGPPGGGARVGPDRAALDLFERVVSMGVNAPPTSSLGRVFDGAAYLLGLCALNRTQAEAAIALESAADAHPGAVDPLPCELRSRDGKLLMRVAPAMAALSAGRRRGEPVGLLAARLHETLARLLSDAAAAACRDIGMNMVVLSGGCFANRRLRERTVALLESGGLRVLLPRRASTGDAGLALGQAYVTWWRMQRSAQRRREVVHVSGGAGSHR